MNKRGYSKIYKGKTKAPLVQSSNEDEDVEASEDLSIAGYEYLLNMSIRSLTMYVWLFTCFFTNQKVAMTLPAHCLHVWWIAFRERFKKLTAQVAAKVRLSSDAYILNRSTIAKAKICQFCSNLSPANRLLRSKHWKPPHQLNSGPMILTLLKRHWCVSCYPTRSATSKIKRTTS